ESHLSPVPAWALWTKRTSAWRALAVRVINPVFWVLPSVTLLLLVGAAWDSVGRGSAQRVRAWSVRNALSPRALFKLSLPMLSLTVALLIAEGRAGFAVRRGL